MTKAERRFPIGAEFVEGGVSFRVWAPDRRRVDVVLADGEHPLAAEADGYFAAVVPGVAAGAEYRFRLDGEETLYPDPASRAQPRRPQGASAVVDPTTFAWTDGGWAGLAIAGQVIMEIHIGTFTREGTWAAAADKLPLLKEVGITVVNMMPVNEFPGRFGWGYDGVDLFAPTHLYGKPDDLRGFVDRAHALGLGVILDVVYNHFGPDGNVMSRFAADYFTDRHATDWGEALNYDGHNRHGMRDLVVANAAYWIEEYHFDGLRLDATQNIYDASPPKDHVITALARAARAAAGPRSIIIVAENEPQNTDLIRSVEAGGYGLDGVWNDDVHHAALVAATGRNEAYYQDYQGTPQELIAAAKYGYLFQGQTYAASRQGRGVPALDMKPAAFVTFIENHDQIANSARGLRLNALVGPARLRALTTYQLLMPGTPMLFQGQEFWASSPFAFFADHHPDLAALVRKGRHASLAMFASLADETGQAQLPDPESEHTFRVCRLDWSEREKNAGIVAFHRDLLAMRARTPAFSANHRPAVDGSVIGPEAFVLRFFDEGEEDRLLFVNLGRDLHLRSLAEPLTAPPRGRAWTMVFSSEHPAYGGTGTPPVITASGGWTLPGNTAVVLGPGASVPVSGLNEAPA